MARGEYSSSQQRWYSSTAITTPALVTGILSAAHAEKHRVAWGVAGATVGALVGALLEHFTA